MSKELRFDGRVAIITGAGNGLGRSHALLLASRGARVVVNDLGGSHRGEGKSSEAADKVVQEIKAAGGEAVANYDSVEDGDKIVQCALDSFGQLDILVNNAGISQNLPLALLEEADWDHVMDTNVKGTYLTSRAALRSMIRRKSGVILNLGSLAGERMIEAPIHYCASKAAIRGLSQAMAKEVARHNVRVLCLAPGLLEDGLGRNLPEYRLEAYLHHCSLGRVGTFDEVARFAAFLVSDHNGYMSGETILMDGGV